MKFIHRELYDKDKPDGYLVSDREYMEANQELVLMFLDAMSKGNPLRTISTILKTTEVPPQPDYLKDV